MRYLGVLLEKKLFSFVKMLQQKKKVIGSLTNIVKKCEVHRQRVKVETHVFLISDTNILLKCPVLLNVKYRFLWS